MAKNKTAETTQSVADFIEKVNDPVKRKDSHSVSALMQELTGFEPKMWGPSIIGFGSYHYKYESGHEGDAPLIGFSPRSTAITLYISMETEVREELLQQLGKHKTGKGCIYIKKLDDVSTVGLAKMIGHSVSYLRKKYPESWN
jgi:hypothetical protein